MRDYLAERLAREEVRETPNEDWEELFSWSEEERTLPQPEEERETASSVTELQELSKSAQTGTEWETLETLAGRVSDLVAEKLTGQEETIPGETIEQEAGAGALPSLRRGSPSGREPDGDGSLWVPAERLRPASGGSSALSQATLAALDRAVEREARRYDGAYTFY